jgi:predicted alpha-1,6-mannanase (GH76 family)
MSCRSGERGDVDKSLFSDVTVVYFSPLAPTVAREAAAEGAAMERARAPVGSGMRPDAMAC